MKALFVPMRSFWFVLLKFQLGFKATNKHYLFASQVKMNLKIGQSPQSFTNALLKLKLNLCPM